MSHPPIAIIGMACRFPGGESPEAFWELLRSGTHAVKPIPPERFELQGPHFAGQLSELGGFDSEYFGVTPTEAASMDLQQRLMLELGVEALLDAGQPSENLRGKKVGVFIGVSSVDYTHTQLQGLDQVNMYTITGAATSVIANRLSYFFDFHGPSLVVDTACSSALTALHLALQSLRNGQAEMALVGGVNILLSPLLQQGFEEAQALAPDGKCKTFDAAADGMVRGEGAGLVMLKPLAQAQVDQDRIYAVICGSGLSQDGQTNGLSAPSPAGQRRSLQAACADADIDPAQVAYVETHGTGTPLGDPVEARALGEVYGQARLNSALPPLKMGSVKTQIGHLEAAAGIAGLIKACLSLYHRTLTPSLHFQTPNPHIPFAKWHLQVVSQTQALLLPNEPPMASSPEGSPALIGVSAFGFGGTNVHVLLAAAPQMPTPTQVPIQTDGHILAPKESTQLLLPLSAHSQAALAQRAADLSTWLQTQPALQLNDLQYSLAMRQTQGHYRASLVFDSRADLQTGLKHLSAEPEPGLKTLKKSARKLVFLFSGMGSQEKGMGQQLLSEPVFAARLNEVDAALRPLTGFSVREAVQNGYQDSPEIVQPVLFALQLALFALWQAWGLRPDALIGTSMGEISAACAGGWLKLEDAAHILVKRIGLLKAVVGSGAMGIIGLSAEAVAARLAAAQESELWIAGLNGPELTVVSGQEQALERCLNALQAEKVFARRVKGADAPSHSPLMEALKAPLLDAIAGIQPQAGHTPVYSTVNPSDEPQTDFGPDYWWQNLRQAVQLLPAFEKRLANGETVFVEISPHPVLTAGLLGVSDSSHLLPSLRRDIPTARPLFESLGTLHSLGFEVDWQALIAPHPCLLSLPLYPWQRIPCWLPRSEMAQPLNKALPARSPLATRLKGHLDNGQNHVPGLSTESHSREGLIRQLQVELATALRLDAALLNPSEPLKHLGIGSLVGMELFSRLKKKFGVKLPLAQFLQGPSLEEIADMILNGLQAQNPAPERLRPDKLPLSFAQTRFWLLEQLQPQERTHFIPVALEITGPLEIAALHKACQSVIQRHEILRTVYRQDEKGQPFQVILADPPPCWEVIDSVNSDADMLQAILKRYARLPFDWENTPPLRFSLFVLKSEDDSVPQSDTPPDPNFQRYVLLLSLHHIVADGLSFRVLFQELQAVYTAELLEKQPVLPTLTWQYADFALWQREQLEKDPSLKADLAYWQKTLTGTPVQTLLQRGWHSHHPNTHPEFAGQEPLAEVPGAQLPFLLPSDTYLALENLAKASGKSLFSLLLTGFYLLLWKYAENNDLVVGTPVAGRLESDTQDLIGPFLNMLPLRVQIDPEQDLQTLLDQVQNQVLLALEHQATPFEQMVEVLQPPRIPGLHPLFQTVLALHGEIGFAPLGECQLRPIALDIGVARFDLAFTLIPEQGALKGSVEYNCQLFDADTIQNLVSLWLAILAELPKWPQARVLKDWEMPGGKGIDAPDWFSQPSSQAPPERLLPMLAGESDTLALIDYQAAVPLRWSYSELWQRARVIAQNLLNLAKLSNRFDEAEHTPLVAVCLPRGAQTVAAWLGILLADKAYLPLDPESPPERLLALLQSLNNPLLICLPETANVLEIALKELQPSSSLPAFTTLSPEAPLSHPHVLPASSQALSNLIFTSGTSGQPKAVKVTQAGMANLIHWHLKTFPSQRGELIPQTAHISFDAAGWEIWSTLAAGATLLFWERNSLLDPLTLQKALLSQQIQQLFLPTPLAALLLQLPWPANTALKCLRTGGDRLPPFQPERLPFQVWNHYGPSECSVVACAGPIKALQPGQLPAIGQLLPGLRAEIRDPQGHLLPWGFPGQLVLSGTGLSPGYLNSQAHSQSYQTGDRLVYLNSQFHFLGRSDRQFKFKGVRIEATEIENTLLRHPEVSGAALLPTEHLLWAFYTGSITSSLLKTWLQSQLPLSLVPARLISLERLPETERGKVDYLALQKYTLSAEDQATGSAQIHLQLPLKSGQMGLEKRIGELWHQLLGQPVHSESDFFALGGHSLLAVQMVMQLRQLTEREIGLHQLFAHPRLADFAKAVAEAKLSPSPLPEVQPQPELAWEPFELTPVQAAYWVGRQAQMALGGVGAQACLELALPDLDLARLELALNRLIRRHPMLQTVISAQGQQQPRKDLPAYTIKGHDLRALPPEVQAEQRQALRQASLEAVFDPLHWPLFECSLIRQSAGPEGATDTVLSLRLDALIADATSFILLGQELETLYRHPESELPPLDLNFGDYMRTLAEIRKSPAFVRDRDYWQERLANLPEAPLLPLLTAPEQLNTPQFKRLSLQLEAPIWQALKAAGATYKLTPNSLVLALFAASLSCWSENESFLINLTTFQRLPLHPQVNQLVGDFTSLNLLEIPPRQGVLADWARQIQQQLWLDLEHSLYSGVEVLRDLRPHGHSGTAPVVFTGLLGQSLPDLPLGAELVFAQTQTPQVWLDCQASESAQGLHVNWDYLVELFPPGLPQALFEAFEQLLRRLANSPAEWQAPLSQKTILGALNSPDQAPTRLAANATKQNIPAQCLHAASVSQALAHPEAPAVISPTRNLSYSELLSEATALAGQLYEQGLERAEPVAIVMHKGWEQAVAVLGILLAGGAYLPIEASLPNERITALLELGQCRWVLLQSPLDLATHLTSLPPLNPTFIPICQPETPLPLPSSAELQELLQRCSPEQSAYVIFTSGSTGQPKGVMIAHQAAWNTVAAINQMLHLQSEDRVWGLSSLSFDLSVYDLFGSWAAGACLVLPPANSGREPDRWLASLQAEGITIWNSVPALLQLLLEYLERSPELHFPALRQILLSGDWIPLALPERIRARAPEAQIWSLGGATEASIWSNFHPIALPLPPDWNSVPYGKPLPNQRFEVFNAHMEPCPEWVAGELCISGEGLALGYWQDPEKTAERFVLHPQTGERWYRTGDRGRYRPGAVLEFLGRRDNQVKIQGYRIELGEIESCLRQHPQLAEALVTAPYQGDKLSQRSLCAYYLPRGPISVPELESYLSSRLPAWMVPHQWLALEAFPLNSSGKPDRKQLPAIASKGSKTTHSAAQSQTEAQLKSLFHEVLDLEINDPEADLLGLGVNSIDLIRLGNRLQQEFGFAPGVGEMFQLRSLRQLAQYYSTANHSQRPTAGSATVPAAAVNLGIFAEKKLPSREQIGPETTFITPQAAVGSENWKSTRHFLSVPLKQTQLAELLAVLAEYPGPQGPRYLYPSAGGVYPLLVYLHVMPGKIEQLGAGLYLYQAHKHTLIQLSPEAPALSELHLPNSLEMAQASAFSLYLVADLAGMTARYGSDARDYCLIEAGAMVQLLREQAAQIGLGLCSVSRVNAALLEAPCAWQVGDECLHSLVGGLPDVTHTINREPESPSQVALLIQNNDAQNNEEWEEWVF